MKLNLKAFGALLLSFVASHVVLASNEGSGVMSINPSPSPTAREVVFAADFDSPDAQLHLWISNLDGSNLHRLSTSPYAKVDEEPSWSPDGSTIAFSSFNGTTSDIWIVSATGGRLTQLTNALNNHQPVWSPDGRKIAFVSDRGGSNDVWIMNADGSGVVRLTRLPGQEDHPSFSPDGSALVFSETVNDQATLMVVNADGSNLRPVTTGAFNDWNPSWGAKGIAFASNRDKTSEHWKLWLVQPDGTGLQQIGDVITLDPAWTSDGRILFTDEPGGNVIAAVSLLDPRTGAKRRVVTAEGYAVSIDIRPGKTPNFINPRSRGSVAVAILSKPGFDAVTSVDRATLRFGATGTEASLRHCKPKAADVNRDGLPDLVCLFNLSLAGFSPTDKFGILRFSDTSGNPDQRASVFEGRDIISISKDDDHDDDDD